MRSVDLDELTSFLDDANLGCTQRECKPNETVVQHNNHVFLLEQPKITRVGTRKNSCVVRKCVKMLRVGKQKDGTIVQIVDSLLDDHHYKKEEFGSVGELSKVCSQIVLKCLYLVCIGRPDILWSVNKLARSVTRHKLATDDWQD